MFSNKEIKTLYQLTTSPQWTVLKDYLLKLQEQTVKELAMGQSEQAMYRSQGKWNLLEQLIHLQDNLKNN